MNAVVVQPQDNLPASTNPFHGSAIAQRNANNAIADAGQQREIAEVQAAMVIAKRFPRDPIAATEAIAARLGLRIAEKIVTPPTSVDVSTEVLKLLLDVGESLAGRLLQFDALGMRFREVRLGPDPACAVCAPGRPFPGYIDYAAFCAGAGAEPGDRP